MTNHVTEEQTIPVFISQNTIIPSLANTLTKSPNNDLFLFGELYVLLIILCEYYNDNFMTKVRGQKQVRQLYIGELSTLFLALSYITMLSPSKMEHKFILDINKM